MEGVQRYYCPACSHTFPDDGDWNTCPECGCEETYPKEESLVEGDQPSIATYDAKLAAVNRSITATGIHTIHDVIAKLCFSKLDTETERLAMWVALTKHVDRQRGGGGAPEGGSSRPSMAPSHL